MIYKHGLYWWIVEVVPLEGSRRLLEPFLRVKADVVAEEAAGARLVVEGVTTEGRLRASFPQVKPDVVERAAEAWWEVAGATTEGTKEVAGTATEGAKEVEVMSDAATEGAEETARDAVELTVVERPLSMVSISISSSSRSMVCKESKPELSGSARARHSSTAINHR